MHFLETKTFINGFM